MTTQLFTARTTDGQSSELNWSGGFGTFVVGGTFNSVTVKLEMSPDGATTWFDVGADVTLTEAGIANFQLGVCVLRVDLASTSSPAPSINAWVV